MVGIRDELQLALIDAANDPDTLPGLIGDTPLTAIITAHRHWDYHAALRQVQQATGASTIAHPEEPIPVTRPVRHGDTISVGNARLSVIYLRGHGSQVLSKLQNGSPQVDLRRGFIGLGRGHLKANGCCRVSSRWQETWCDRRVDRWIRRTTIGCVAILALIVGTVSYMHMHDLVALHGQPGWVAALTPFSVDGMIVAAAGEFG